MFVIYLSFVVFTNWGHRDRWLLLMPLYAAFSSLVMLALALPS
jgi:hypothetical protein